MVINSPYNLSKFRSYSLIKHAIRSLAILLLCIPDAAHAVSKPSDFLPPRKALIEALQNERSIKADEPTTQRTDESDCEPSSRGEHTVLFDLDGSVSSEFAGTFFEITPDGEGVITYSVSESQWYLYSLDGTELSVLKGLFQGFTPDLQSIITYLQGKSYLYDLDGVEQATFTGAIQWSTVEGDYLIAVISDRPGFSLYSAEGSLQATFDGFFQGFVPNEQKLVVIDNMGSRLYHFDGSLDAAFDGMFRYLRLTAKGW